MKKISIILLLVFVASICFQPATFAINTKPSGKRAPPMSTEDDGYRADTDPLPEWLLLPDEVDENSLSFAGSQTATLIIKQTGSTRWAITTKKNGRSIAYSYYENNKRQFVIKTNKDYSKFTIYLVKGKKLQKTQSLDPDDYFDISKHLSLVNDNGFSVFASASAESHFRSPATKKRVSSKLTKRQINKLNHAVGFKGTDAAIANRVAYYESAGGKTKVVACENDTATGFNPPYGGSKGVAWCKDRGALGAGRGLYQISSQWHPKCSNKCAFSPERNAKYAYKLRKKGGWTQWCSYGGCGSNDPNAPGRGPAMQ